jgi:hypothetical protein
MKEKVIFDTNFLLEKKMKNFFGKQEELHKFEKLSSILPLRDTKGGSFFIAKFLI